MKLRKLSILLLLGCAALNAQAEDSFERCARLGHWRKCVTVPLASAEEDAAAKEFQPPRAGKAKIYIARPRTIEPKIKSAVFFDGEPVASLAPMTYIVIETDPGMHYVKVHTEQDFEIALDLAPGKIYYLEHRLSLFFNTVSGALKAVDEGEGKSQVLKSKLAKTTAKAGQDKIDTD
jgi:hypothetical protein